jgi:hypothetical protein
MSYSTQIVHKGPCNSNSTRSCARSHKLLAHNTSSLVTQEVKILSTDKYSILVRSCAHLRRTLIIFHRSHIYMWGIFILPMWQVLGAKLHPYRGKVVAWSGYGLGFGPHFNNSVKVDTVSADVSVTQRARTAT